MALSGIAIYKLLPQTNCKECGYPTCLAFAMKLAARQAELSACPYVSDEAKAQLDSASAPPIRLDLAGRATTRKVEVGNETVVYRHEKTFVHQPGLFLRLPDDLAEADFDGRSGPGRRLPDRAGRADASSGRRGDRGDRSLGRRVRGPGPTGGRQGTGRHPDHLRPRHHGSRASTPPGPRVRSSTPPTPATGSRWPRWPRTHSVPPGRPWRGRRPGRPGRL